jgi:hypothetical protein
MAVMQKYITTSYNKKGCLILGEVLVRLLVEKITLPKTEGRAKSVCKK